MQTEGISIRYDITFILLLSFYIIQAMTPIPPYERRASEASHDAHTRESCWQYETYVHIDIYIL